MPSPREQFLGERISMLRYKSIMLKVTSLRLIFSILFQVFPNLIPPQKYKQNLMGKS
jgi:hypothetical protein